MRFPFLLCLSMCCLIASAQTKKVCFTYDDLPIVSYGNNDTTFLRKLNEKLLDTLEAQHVPAIGFVNESKLYNAKRKEDRFQVSLLQSWLDHGLDLGNHTYAHRDFNATDFEVFTKEIIKGEAITRHLLKKRGKDIKYFRHPFLHCGDTKSRADSLDNFLSRHHYTVAPVTIDNADYIFAVTYHRAVQKKDYELAEQIGRDYLIYMERCLLYYESLSDKLFSRNISHVLLLHESLLNSDYAGSLIRIFRNNGYTFVSLDHALEDPAYHTEITVFGKWGISWIDRWALSKGKGNDVFADEPRVPDYISKLAALR